MIPHARMQRITTFTGDWLKPEMANIHVFDNIKLQDAKGKRFNCKWLEDENLGRRWRNHSFAVNCPRRHRPLAACLLGCVARGLQQKQSQWRSSGSTTLASFSSTWFPTWMSTWCHRSVRRLRTSSTTYGEPCTRPSSKTSSWRPWRRFLWCWVGRSTSNGLTG